MGVDFGRRAMSSATAGGPEPQDACGAAQLQKAMRGFLDFCMAQNLIKVDPLAGTKLSKMKTLGHHTWTDEEIAKYQAHHAPGTKARLALELLLQTGHARADV